MPTVEAKKRIHRSLRGLGILAGNRRTESAGGLAVQSADPSRNGGQGLNAERPFLERFRSVPALLLAASKRTESVREYHDEGTLNPALGGYEKS